MYHLALKCYKSRLLRCILRIQYPRVLLFFTLSATANTVHVLILRACKCILSEHASCRDVDLNPGSSLTSGVRTLTRTYGEYRTCYVYSTFSRGVSHLVVARGLVLTRLRLLFSGDWQKSREPDEKRLDIKSNRSHMIAQKFRH